MLCYYYWVGRILSRFNAVFDRLSKHNSTARIVWMTKFFSMFYILENEKNLTPKNHQNHRINANQNHCGWHLAAVLGCGPVVHALDLDIIWRKLFFSQCSSQCKNDLTKKWLCKDTKNPFLYARNSSGIGRKQVGFNFGRATSCAPSGRLPVWPDWNLKTKVCLRS